MSAKREEKKAIISLAEKAKRYCDLLVEQSDSWLPEEAAANAGKRPEKRPESKRESNKPPGKR